MTTLKSYYADEIATSLYNKLNDEGFLKFYKKAESDVVAKYKEKVDAIVKDYEDGNTDKKTAKNKLVDLRNEVNELPEEREPILEYIDKAEKHLENVITPDMKSPKAEDGCDHMEEETCSKCADSSVLVATDFAIKHMVKIADALDQAGFVGISKIIDETINKLSSNKPIIVNAAKKKKPGRTFKEWVKIFNKKSPGAGEKFSKTFKGALEYAKKIGMSKETSEEYAMRTALDKMPKSYFKNPGPEHGPEKSGPLAAKRPKK